MTGTFTSSAMDGLRDENAVVCQRRCPSSLTNESLSQSVSRSFLPRTFRINCRIMYSKATRDIDVLAVQRRARLR